MRELKNAELKFVSGGELPFITSAKKWFNDLIESSKQSNVEGGFAIGKFFAGAVLKVADLIFGRFLHPKKPEQ